MPIDQIILRRQEKNIKFGKETAFCQQYMAAIPKEIRENWMPRTPNRLGKYCRRNWDVSVSD